MQPSEFRTRLIQSAHDRHWTAEPDETLTAKRFRGRSDDSDVPLPADAFGLLVGAYPVIVMGIQLENPASVLKTLRQAHNQVVIARSFMASTTVINTHVFFVASTPPADADWEKLIDLAERDETVCRKLVWIPNISAIGESYDAFLERTFLAQPWRDSEEFDSAPLDQNDRLVEKVLQDKGLTLEAAAKWIEIAQTDVEDPQDRVEQLVSAMELKP